MICSPPSACSNSRVNHCSRTDVCCVVAGSAMVYPLSLRSRVSQSLERVAPCSILEQNICQNIEGIGAFPVHRRNFVRSHAPRGIPGVSAPYTTSLEPCVYWLVSPRNFPVGRLIRAPHTAAAVWGARYRLPTGNFLGEPTSHTAQGSLCMVPILRESHAGHASVQNFSDAPGKLLCPRCSGICFAPE